MMVEAKLKVCPSCGVEKPAHDFGYDRSRDDKRKFKCRVCVAEYDKKRKQELVEKDAKGFYSEQYRRTRKWASRSPRLILSQTLRAALLRCVTENPVTLDELMEIFNAQVGRCALTGLELTWSGRYEIDRDHHAPRYNSMSIDRLDQSKGYEVGNVRLVCYCINSFRGQMSDDEMYLVAEALLRARRAGI